LYACAVPTAIVILGVAIPKTMQVPMSIISTRVQKASAFMTYSGP
jgi:hypothetical protein